MVFRDSLTGETALQSISRTIRQAGILALVLFARPGLATEADTTEKALESPRLAALTRSAAAGDGQALTTFWRHISQVHTPLVEPAPGHPGEMLVTFLWRADHDGINVNVLSPLGEIELAHAVPERLARLAQTDVWFRTYRTSDQARFEYALAWPQGREPNATANETFSYRGIAYESFSDPLNPRSMPSQWDEQPDGKTWADRVRRTSYVEGPNAPAEPFIVERSGVKRGKLVTTEFTSKLLGNTRRISIYTPPGLDRGDEQCDFLLLFDRAEYVMAVPTPTILDNMQAAGVLRPIVALFVGNAPDARSKDLPPNPQFQKFLQHELLPWVRARYRFTTDPRRSVVGGSSFGGLAAAYAGFVNPDVFGNVLSQSGSYWWWPDFRYSGRDVDALDSDAGWMMRQYAAAERLPLRFYMDAGLLEGTLMLLPNRMFRDVLRSKGYEVIYREFAGAHDYIMWRSTLSDGLIALIGNSSRTTPSSESRRTTRPH